MIYIIGCYDVGGSCVVAEVRKWFTKSADDNIYNNF